jgi:ABC-type transport system involved in Fe-S cluster assembly fused permease/ATPase subunit
MATAAAPVLSRKLWSDDPGKTSVDTDTEHQSQEAMARLIRGRTTFAIARARHAF